MNLLMNINYPSGRNWQEKNNVSFRIDKKLINKAKKGAKKSGLCTSVFIRQAVVDKMSHNNKLKELRERIIKLENKILWFNLFNF